MGDRSCLQLPEEGAELDSWPAGVGAITLFVEDLEAAKRFYQDVFGLPVAFEDDDLVGRIGLLHEEAEVEAGGATADADDLQRTLDRSTLKCIVGGHSPLPENPLMRTLAALTVCSLSLGASARPQQAAPQDT